MAGFELQLKLDEESWRVAVQAFERMAASDQEAFLDFIGMELLNIAQDAFQNEADPATGAGWAPWSPSYAAKARNQGGPGSKKLDRMGDLFRSLAYEVRPASVAVGSNMIYAAVHQLGAKKGAFGQTRRGQPIPFGDIPARPFLGVPADFSDRILGDPAIRGLLELPV
jgi:phage virion morphogenesis protein